VRAGLSQAIGLRAVVGFPVEINSYFFAIMSRPALGFTQNPIQQIVGTLFSRRKGLKRESESS
jgi:hypothetical protein